MKGYIVFKIMLLDGKYVYVRYVETDVISQDENKKITLDKIENKLVILPMLFEKSNELGIIKAVYFDDQYVKEQLQYVICTEIWIRNFYQKKDLIKLLQEIDDYTIKTRKIDIINDLEEFGLRLFYYPQYQDDVRFVRAALVSSPEAMLFAAKEVRRNEEVVQHAMRHSYSALFYCNCFYQSFYFFITNHLRENSSADEQKRLGNLIKYMYNKKFVKNLSDVLSVFYLEYVNVYSDFGHIVEYCTQGRCALEKAYVLEFLVFCSIIYSCLIDYGVYQYLDWITKIELFTEEGINTCIKMKAISLKNGELLKKDIRNKNYSLMIYRAFKTMHRPLLLEDNEDVEDFDYLAAKNELHSLSYKLTVIAEDDFSHYKKFSLKEIFLRFGDVHGFEPEYIQFLFESVLTKSYDNYLYVHENTTLDKIPHTLFEFRKIFQTFISGNYSEISKTELVILYYCFILAMLTVLYYKPPYMIYFISPFTTLPRYYRRQLTYLINESNIRNVSDIIMFNL